MASNETNIRVRCSKETKRKWNEMLNWIDPDVNNEEAVEVLHHFFEQDRSRIRDLQRIDSPPTEFR